MKHVFGLKGFRARGIKLGLGLYLGLDLRYVFFLELA